MIFDVDKNLCICNMIIMMMYYEYVIKKILMYYLFVIYE
jgi:hypothetical protein